MSNNNISNVSSSYAYNIPLFILLAFILAMFTYNILHAYRDRNDIIKHKVETEIQKKIILLILLFNYNLVTIFMCYPT